MIVWRRTEVPLGTILLAEIRDHDMIIRTQPVKVLRKASKEEYIEYYREMTGYTGDFCSLEDLFFYEISTD